MRKIVLFTLLVLSLALTIPATGAEASDKLTKAEAETLVKNLLKGQELEITVKEVMETPISGLWGFTVSIQGQPFVIYTDAMGENVILPAQGLQAFMLNINTGEVYTKAILDDMSRINFADIPLKDALILGDAKAAIKVAVFDDPY